MARYTWDTHSLINRLRKIEKLMQKETDEVELARLLHYYDVVNSAIYDSFCFPQTGIPLSKRMPTMLSKFLAKTRYYSLLDPYNDAIGDNEDLFNEVLKKKKDIQDQINKATGAYVTKGEAISVCYDFYKNLDEELFEHFKRFYDMRFNHLRFTKPKDVEDDNYLGFQHYLYGVDESFIEVIGTNKPGMTSTMIHETAHAIDNSMNPDSYLADDYFYEVVSIFMQLVYYYKKTSRYDELYYYDSLVGYLAAYDADAAEAYTYADIMYAYMNNSYHISPEFYEALRNDYKLSKKDVNTFLNTYNVSDMCYPISAAMALSFFNIYKQDEKKGIENLKRFIKSSKRDDYIPLVLSEQFSNLVSDEVKSLLTESKECFERHTK